MTFDWTKITDWKLKSGSHKFPGPDGGTCINEAAIVAAGFEYRSVKSHEDCPPCFSPVLAQFAIVVNDQMRDGERQRLMGLVHRLSGSAGPDWADAARARFLVSGIFADLEPALSAGASHVSRQLGYDRFLPLDAAAFVARGLRFGEEPTRLFAAAERETRHGDLVAAISALHEALRLTHRDFSAIGYVSWPEHSITPSSFSLEFDAPVTASLSINHRTFGAADVWPLAATWLERAFEIGNKAPAIETAKVVERLRTVREAALT